MGDSLRLSIVFCVFVTRLWSAGAMTQSPWSSRGATFATARRLLATTSRSVTRRPASSRNPKSTVP
jgi:hypothetical protein